MRTLIAGPTPIVFSQARVRPVSFGVQGFAVKGTARMKMSFGFTLVELLIVVAVITILLGLLIPALVSAREQVKKISCASNLRQLGVASVNYSSDFGDIVVPTDFYGVGYWNGILVGGSYIKAPLVDSKSSIPQMASVLRCPSGLLDKTSLSCPSTFTDPEGARPYWSSVPGTAQFSLTWYGCNGSTANGDTFPTWRVTLSSGADIWPRLRNIKYPSATASILDACSAFNLLSYYRINARHCGGTRTNILFWDGRVANFLAAKELPGGGIYTTSSALNARNPSVKWRTDQ
jgi:prepilin-type N-terminal cleavage/methylation domain-containing protein/prepilin-type processing-associated H-X9-DG protein